LHCQDAQNAKKFKIVEAKVNIRRQLLSIREQSIAIPVMPKLIFTEVMLALERQPQKGIEDIQKAAATFESAAI
jgi:hypothetical protein